MIKVQLCEYDSKLIGMYEALYNTTSLTCEGKNWFVSNEDRTIEFKGYKGFIDFIEEEVKSSLLTYALNNELEELAEVLK